MAIIRTVSRTEDGNEIVTYHIPPIWSIVGMFCVLFLVGLVISAVTIVVAWFIRRLPAFLSAAILIAMIIAGVGSVSFRLG